jgi:hypothetical protein
MSGTGSAQVTLLLDILLLKTNIPERFYYYPLKQVNCEFEPVSFFLFETNYLNQSIEVI